MPARRPALRKSLGQHHLVSGALCRPLLDFLAPLAGARVVEVGPGGGVLTLELLAAGAAVLAWELDPAWAFNAIRAVGNYGELFERTLGPKTPIGLERGLNRLWTDGGLMYSWPMR